MKKLFYLIVALFLMTSNINAAETNGLSSDFSGDTFLALQDVSNTYQVAATYFLPDHIGNNRARVNDEGGSSEDSSVTCATYGALASCPESTMDYSVYYPLPSKKNPVCVKNCKCSPLKYKFTTSNCPNGYTIGGNSCGGKFESCDVISCPSGSKTDQSCLAGFEAKETGKSGTKTCYSCEAKACPTGTATDKTCEKEQEVVDSGEKSGTKVCFGCKDIVKTCEDICSGVYSKNPSCRDGQTKESCSSECGEWKRCVGEPCKGVLAGNCSYPCNASNRNPAAGCGNYCLSCGTCPTNDCSGFTLTTIPNNASVTSCRIGCGDEAEKFKLSSCNDGYGDYKNYWCSDDLSCWTPNPSKESCVSTDCTALGYVMTTAQCTGEAVLKCPYNQSKIFCAICTPPAGYTLVADGNINSTAFKTTVKNACRVEENFIITTDECGKIYYKCAIPEAAYKYTTESCDASSNGGNTKRVVSGSYRTAQAYAKSITMYVTCDCPTDITRTDCSSELNSGLALGGWDACFYYVTGRSNQWGRISCTSVVQRKGGSGLYLDGKSCKKPNGMMAYERCTCDRATFPDNGRGSTKNKDRQYCCRNYSTSGEGFCHREKG